MNGKYTYPKYRSEVSGTYKLTDDFQADVGFARRVVRDINFTPNDRRLPDLGICRVFSTREDAKTILRALVTSAAAAASGIVGN